MTNAIDYKNDKIAIPYWFISKNLNRTQADAIVGERMTVERETEKAVLVKWNTDYGFVTLWTPKSIIVTEEQARTEAKAEAEKRMQSIKQGEERYNKMIAFAKENGLAVRNKMKKDTVMSMIKKAGLEYNY
nr:MAG TPA: hypothetical protein [Caudoviricetes sp.]